ncbi:FkbM family methyltransferase [Candidatus Microgenomates bacterium]|nr:FkbM family methyltransferase [Candidatus Microgenomates bacterium]
MLKHRLKRFYSQFIHKDSLVFDIGTNDGDYAESFLELGGRVIGVEPQPIYLEKLQKRFAGNKQITILPNGIGETKGIKDFYISSFNSPNSTFSTEFKKNSRYSYRTWDKVIKVHMITFQDLLKQYGTPDFCKIDVEGYEWEVLSTLKKPLPCISFEFLAEMNDKTFTIINHLDTLGKPRYNVCLGMQYTYALPEWITGKELRTLLKKNHTKHWNGDIYVVFEEAKKTRS